MANIGLSPCKESSDVVLLVMRTGNLLPSKDFPQIGADLKTQISADLLNMVSINHPRKSAKEIRDICGRNN